MIHVFDFNLIRGADENSLVLIKDKNGEMIGISTLSTDEDGNVILTVDSGKNQFCDLRKCTHDGKCDECFTKEFWLEEVVDEWETHFVDGDDAYFYTDGYGGFDNQRFKVEFEDGEVLKNQGLWHRGRIPNSVVKHLLRKGSRRYDRL